TGQPRTDPARAQDPRRTRDALAGPLRAARCRPRRTFTQRVTMPITSVHSDPKALTLTLVGDYPVPVERLWEAWADPRQLERFWGPESWPATFLRHDMKVGGRSHYFMTGPEGERSPNCFWEFQEVDAPRRLEVTNG